MCCLYFLLVISCLMNSIYRRTIFPQYFIMKMFKYTKKLKDFSVNKSNTYHLNFTIRMLLSWLHLSIYSFCSFYVLVHLNVNCRYQYTSSSNSSACMSLTEFSISLQFFFSFGVKIYIQWDVQILSIPFD